MARGTDLPRQTGGKTFCQIVGRDITPVMCLESQGHEGCFGCAAPTRLCELCRKRSVDVPAVGMCSPCLIGQLQRESSQPAPTINALTKVDCQILRRQISGQMCRATQGQDGCRNCAVATRLCEACRRHPVRYKEYGLCLACSVEEYGGGWDRGTAETAITNETPDPPRLEVVRSPRKLEDMVFIAVSDLAHQQTELPADVHATPVETVTPETILIPQGSATERTSTMVLSGREYRVTVRVAAPRGGDKPMSSQGLERVYAPKVELEKLVRSGQEIVVRHRRASVGLLASELGVSRAIAKEVIDQLEKDGVVGPERPKTSRVVLGLPQEAESAPKPEPKKPGRKGGKPEALAEKARELILEHRNATYEFLQQKLGTGALTTKRILQILEQQGVVSPVTRGQPRRILVENTGTSNPTKGPRVRRAGTSFEAKVSCLEELAKFFGPRSDVSRTMREIGEDLEELRRIKETLRRLGQE